MWSAWLCVHGVGQEKGWGRCMWVERPEWRVAGWECGCTVSNHERTGTLPAHCNELFLLPSQVQCSPANKDGICHEVPQPSLPQVPLQVRRTNGRREGEIPVSCGAELLKFQWAHKSLGHLDKI